MNSLRFIFGNAVHSAAVAAGFELEPQDMGLKVIGSGQTFEEPAAESPAPPAMEEIFINRHERRKLGIPKGELGAFVAANSIDSSALFANLTEIRSRDMHRSHSTGYNRFSNTRARH